VSGQSFKTKLRPEMGDKTVFDERKGGRSRRLLLVGVHESEVITEELKVSLGVGGKGREIGLPRMGLHMLTINSRCLRLLLIRRVR